MMKHIGTRIQSRFSQRNMSQSLVGTICLNTLKKELGLNELTGYIRFSTLFITEKNQKLRIEVFRKKKIFLNIINKKLSTMGIKNNIKDILFK